MRDTAQEIAAALAGQGTGPGAGQAAPPVISRLAIDPATAERDLARLVLTLVELVRRLLEAQAVRRMEAGSVTAAEVERLGSALLATRDAVAGLCDRLGLAPEDLNLDLGPLGKLL